MYKCLLCNSSSFWLCIYWTPLSKRTRIMPLHWCHNECNGFSNHRWLDCVLNRLFGCRSKKTLKVHIIGLCEGNSLVTGEFPAQKASNTENVSFWWRHHVNIVITMSANDARGQGINIVDPISMELPLFVWGKDGVNQSIYISINHNLFKCCFLENII